MLRDGRFYPDHGLDRIVAFHERQDARYAEAAAALSTEHGKPILTATELAYADPGNPGPAAVRASGRLAYPSGNRAVTALGHLYRDARHRAPRGRTLVSTRAGRPRRPAVNPVVVLGLLALIPGAAAVPRVALGRGARRGRRAATADERRPAGARRRR